MKKLTYVTAIVCLFSLPYVQADDRHHPQPGPAAGTAAMSPAAGGNMDMQHMQEMQMMMERIQKSTDPAERDRLILEHMDHMQKMMGEMHGMMGKGTAGGVSVEDRQNTMEKRMDMMQGMMERMMEQMKVGEVASQSRHKGAQHDLKKMK